MKYIKHKIILFILFSNLFGYTSVLESPNYVLKNNEHTFNYKNNININNNVDIKERLKPLLYSALVPGLGQYHNGKKIKALLFFGMEIAGFIGYFHYQNQGDKFRSEYQIFGQEHWHIDTWFSNYYQWNNPDEDSPYFDLFSKDDDGDGIHDTYVHIWEDSHHIEFSYLDNDGIRRIVHSNNEDVMELLWDEHDLDDEESAENFIFDFEVEIERDHHFYENIYKYNHFFAGWDDHDMIEYDSSNAYHTAFSPNKRHYQSLYTEKINAFKIKRSFTSFIFFTHAASMLDALIDSRFSENLADVDFGFDSAINCYAIRLRINL